MRRAALDSDLMGPRELPDDQRRETSHRQENGQRVEQSLPALPAKYGGHGIR
jgi:hypothetical protein